MEEKQNDRTIEDLDGEVWGDPEFSSHVVTECHRLRKVPLRDMTIENIRLLVSQEVGLRFVIPVALDMLDRDVWAQGDFFRGDLLCAVLAIGGEHWVDHPDHVSRVSMIIEEVQDHINLATEKILPAYEDMFQRISDAQ